MSRFDPEDFAKIYANFDSPVTQLNCGEKCAPYNEYGIPFCCDTNHAIPTAYLPEWTFLELNSNLWHIWEDDDTDEMERIGHELPNEQVQIECLGHHLCQRNFRSITCRAFPFFPYITKEGKFVGMSYYWEYEVRCWVISHLEKVTLGFIEQFMETFDLLFTQYPEDLENFRYHSIIMRRIFGKQKRSIPLLHRDGGAFAVNPKNGALQPVNLRLLPKHGPYKIAAQMPFPDEI